MTTITTTHEKTITIATQNVGGIKLESERGRGPKLATLRNLVSKSTDFLVLTETRVYVCAVRKLKIKYGLKPTAFSLHRRPRGGVIIFSRMEHKLIPDSIRTSNTAGHITAAVYEVATLPTIVVGVYGHSDSSDRASLQVMRDLQLILRELTQVYETQRILVAGDFNAGMEEEDTNSGTNKKPLTTELLQTLLQDYHLVDIGAKLNNKSHTWLRRDSSGQSSRIDYLLSSIPMGAAFYKTTFSVFDHTYLEATLNVTKQSKQKTMKDFILGTDEYIIRSQDYLTELLVPYCDPQQPPPPHPASPASQGSLGARLGGGGVTRGPR